MPNQENVEPHSNPKTNFIDDPKFALLKSYQQHVYEATEVSPTIRKLVNALITDENLSVVIHKMIEALR